MSPQSASFLRIATAAALLGGAARADLIITEVVDGNLSGGQPKYVELTNTGVAPVDLSLYQIVYYNNGATVPSTNGSLPLNAVMLAAGASYTLTTGSLNNPGGYQTAYNSLPDQVVTTFGGHNGDDAIALELIAGGIVDVFGVIGVDGTGQLWEYTDSYAARTTCTASATFNLADWTFGGPGALIGDLTCDNVCKLQTLTTPKVYTACGGGCLSNPTVYCTPKTSSGGCVPSISSPDPTASLATPGDFDVVTVNIEDNKNAITFFSTTGPNGSPFQGGFLCALSPLYRLPVKNSGGAVACAGTVSYTLADMLAHPSGGSTIAANGDVWSQTWFRDPSSPSTTGLSDGLTFKVCP